MALTSRRWVPRDDEVLTKRHTGGVFETICAQSRWSNSRWSPEVRVLSDHKALRAFSRSQAITFLVGERVLK